MRRLIVHYSDGKTFTGDWDTKEDFNKLNVKPISSLQIQTEEAKHTLSTRKKQSAKFWCNYYKNSISILKRIHKDIWIDLNINDSGRNVNIIKANYGK